ncbi:MAG: hypothetical protein ABW321_35275 [Polyangiales bacterium]
MRNQLVLWAMVTVGVGCIGDAPGEPEQNRSGIHGEGSGKGGLTGLGAAGSGPGSGPSASAGSSAVSPATSGAAGGASPVISPPPGAAGSASPVISPPPGVQADVAGLACISGGQRYTSDVFSVDECDRCATANCCDPWVACQQDADCACFVDCSFERDSTREQCLQRCGVTTVPDAARWASCVQDSCEKSCGLNEMMMMQPPPPPGKVLGEPCSSSQECSSGNCLDDGDATLCYGKLIADQPCTDHLQCQRGLCVSRTPGSASKVCLESFEDCAAAGIDTCHIVLALSLCQLAEQCIEPNPSLDRCVQATCQSVVDEVSSSQCDPLLDNIQRDPSCPSQP